jgi:DNA double-strand break repair helicase HerA and related ATPase
MAANIFIGQSPDGPQSIALSRANRHGLIAGATGTGKTVTLQVLAEAFAREGVNVFAADVKGDLSGIAAPMPAPPPGWAAKRATEIGVALTPEAAPSQFWDVYGELGLPVRATVTDMGPVLMARILDASEAQEGALTVAFALADGWLNEGKQEGLLLNLADLRALITYIAENTDAIGKKYGLVTAQSAATLQRKLLQMEMDGADHFFGEPALELADLLKPAPDGRGVVHILAAERLIQAPRLYSTFLLWLLSELWEELPEAGDLEKPKLVFFFDEAHLLFKDATKPLLDRIEQVSRLIRSKGVGVYFISQSPADIPDIVLSQLGNRVQHALRAYTPSDQKAVRAAASSFRANPGVDVAKEIQELAVGEALVSTLDEHGAPTPVARTKVRPPNSQVGTLLLATRKQLMAASPLRAKYEQLVDRDSAYEILGRRAGAQAPPVSAKPQARASSPPSSPARGVRAAPPKPPAGMITASEIGKDVEKLAVSYIQRNILGTRRRRR